MRNDYRNDDYDNENGHTINSEKMMIAIVLTILVIVTLEWFPEQEGLVH
jgi:hypothetical protein